MSGENGVFVSWKTNATMSLPMCRLRCSCCGSPSVYGKSVDTWNIISLSLKTSYIA